MLTLTDNACSVVHDLAEQAGLPSDGGLRITEAADRTSFELSLVPQPADGDELLEQSGARVFLTPEASSALAELELDAESTETGPGFALVPRG